MPISHLYLHVSKTPQVHVRDLPANAQFSFPDPGKCHHQPLTLQILEPSTSVSIGWLPPSHLALGDHFDMRCLIFDFSSSSYQPFTPTFPYPTCLQLDQLDCHNISFLLLLILSAAAILIIKILKPLRHNKVHVQLAIPNSTWSGSDPITSLSQLLCPTQKTQSSPKLTGPFSTMVFCPRCSISLGGLSLLNFRNPTSLEGPVPPPIFPVFSISLGWNNLPLLYFQCVCFVLWWSQPAQKNSVWGGRL